MRTLLEIAAWWLLVAGGVGVLVGKMIHHTNPMD